MLSPRSGVVGRRRVSVNKQQLVVIRQQVSAVTDVLTAQNQASQNHRAVVLNVKLDGKRLFLNKPLIISKHLNAAGWMS